MDGREGRLLFLLKFNAVAEPQPIWEQNTEFDPSAPGYIDWENSEKFLSWTTTDSKKEIVSQFYEKTNHNLMCVYKCVSIREAQCEKQTYTENSKTGFKRDKDKK